MKTSRLESQIITLLKEKGLSIYREYEVRDLRNGKMRYDFYLPDKKIFLECHGPQHYQYTDFFFENKMDFLKAQERDRIKISYALAHHYKLYTYPWFDMPKNSDELFLEKYLVKTKFHNDIVWRAYKESQC